MNRVVLGSLLLFACGARVTVAPSSGAHHADAAQAQLPQRVFRADASAVHADAAVASRAPDSGSAKVLEDSAAARESIQCQSHASGDDSGFDDPDAAKAFVNAKASCDQRFTWQCGVFRVQLGATGCVERFELEQGWSLVAPEYPACIVDHLAGHCDRCARNTSRRLHESCTLL